MSGQAKTQPTDGDVAAFLARAPRPEDAASLCATMAQVTGEAPRMWGGSIVGFGRRSYPLAGGKTGEICAMGFSPRTAALTLYLTHTPDWAERLARLGRCTTGKGCLYLKRLADADPAELRSLIEASWAARA